MFSIAITYGPAATTWVLMYRDEKNAEDAWQKLTSPAIDTHPPVPGTHRLVDDFGQRLCIPTNEIKGLMFENMHESMNAHIERALHQARMQAKGSEQAENDSTLRAARARQQHGPAILQPGFPGNGRYPS